MLTLNTPIAAGELVDKITILEIKSEKITEAEKLKKVRYELEALTAVARAEIPASGDLQDLQAQLKTVNEQLWEIEDDIRDCERQGDFGDVFIQLARSVYKTNDRRAAIKREINTLTGSAMEEVKSYQDYSRPEE